MYGNLSQAHVYFADDDNIYDSHFLNEVRIQTRKLSIFNVGLIGGQTHEGPFINDRGKVRLYVFLFLFLNFRQRYCGGQTNWIRKLISLPHFYLFDTIYSMYLPAT